MKRQCTKCLEDKPLDHNHYSRASRYSATNLGFAYECKLCCAERQRERYAKNPEKYKAQQKIKRQTPEYQAYIKEYKRTHKERDKESAKLYKLKNKDRIREYNRGKYQRNIHKERANHLFKTYGLTTKEYDTMYSAQNGKCKLCGYTPNIKDTHSRNRFLHVDHCHKTNRIRGLLCGNCNTGLGLLKDNVEVLTKAIEYLNG